MDAIAVLTPNPRREETKLRLRNCVCPRVREDYGRELASRRDTLFMIRSLDKGPAFRGVRVAMRTPATRDPLGGVVHMDSIAGGVGAQTRHRCEMKCFADVRASPVRPEP
ncbi:hypothetical protein KC19_9G092500 [Ceratodon purpureus]|uniref:Uncharacterized protein n=1 Tax=Ceratodon purpureus TaxID=3225 RepID=A0A8T0GTT5_CERPU|nr:hypothetical protein KC19_9G092500 [Ceratodon purpureus]